MYFLHAINSDCQNDCFISSDIATFWEIIKKFFYSFRRDCRLKVGKDILGVQQFGRLQVNL